MRLANLVLAAGRSMLPVMSSRKCGHKGRDEPDESVEGSVFDDPSSSWEAQVFTFVDAGLVVFQPESITTPLVDRRYTDEKQ